MSTGGGTLADGLVAECTRSTSPSTGNHGTSAVLDIETGGAAIGVVHAQRAARACTRISPRPPSAPAAPPRCTGPLAAPRSVTATRSSPCRPGEGHRDRLAGRPDLLCRMLLVLRRLGGVRAEKRVLGCALGFLGSRLRVAGARFGLLPLL